MRIFGCLLIAALCVACAPARAPAPQQAAPAISAAVVPEDAEMRIDFAHFPVIFGARHAFLSFYDTASDEETLLFRLHATSVELKRDAGGYRYEFRENIGPCLKTLPFFNLDAEPGFFPDFGAMAPLPLSEDAALFQNRPIEARTLFAGSREETLALTARIIALAADLNEASLDYSYRGDDEPNCNSALFSILRRLGLGAELSRAAEDYWFPGEETPVALPEPGAAPADAEQAARAALRRLQESLEQVSGNEPCAALF